MALALAGLITAGCANEVTLPGTAGEPTTAGAELRVVGYEAASDLGAAVRVYAQPGRLTVTTLGSSSCPDVPEITDVDVENQRVMLSIYMLGREGACTADLAPRTFELSVTGDLDLAFYEVEVTRP